jgi:predicted nucleic acid-binding protein
VTVLDTSAVVDFLLGSGACDAVGALFEREGELAAPDVLVFEALAVVRRLALRGELDERRGRGAVEDLGDLPIELFPTLVLRSRAWELRENLTIADALFVALAEQLGEPLATKDGGLAAAAEAHTDIAVVRLQSRGDDG